MAKSRLTGMLIGGLLLLARASAQERPPADLAGMMEPVRAQNQVPGMAALVLRGDRVVAEGAVGVRKSGAPEPVTLDDQFHLGSCTKAMTGTLVAMAVEEGRLRWDSTLGELFGDLVPRMHPDWRNVTLRQVLAHRAGFPNGNIPGQVIDEPTAAAEKSVEKLRRLVVERELARKPETPPGTKWVYSNVDYIVAAAALEQATGKSWEDLMRERIFRPLGIATGGFGPPGAPGKGDQPWGHTGKGVPVDPGAENADNPPYYGPAAGARMTIGDWSKFVALHLRGDAANPDRRVLLLRAGTFDDLHRWTETENYNAGWGFGTLDVARGSRPGDRGVILGHEGSNGKWYSKMLLAPEINLAVLVVCNRGGAHGQKAVGDLALSLMRKFGTQPGSAK